MLLILVVYNSFSVLFPLILSRDAARDLRRDDLVRFSLSRDDFFRPSIGTMVIEIITKKMNTVVSFIVNCWLA